MNKPNQPLSYARLCYHSAQAQFTDLFSRLGVSIDPNATEPGLHRGHLASQREGKTFAAPLLDIRILDQGPGSWRTECYPWGFVQALENNDVSIHVFVSFAALDVVAIEIQIVNKGNQPRKISVQLSGRAVAEDSHRVTRFDRKNNLVLLEQTSRCTSQWCIRKEPDFRIITAIHPDFPISGAKGTDGAYELIGQPFNLPAGESKVCGVSISAGSYNLEADNGTNETRQISVCALVVRRALSQDQTGSFEKSRARWKEILDRVPLSGVEEEYRPLVREAAVILLKNTIRPQPEQEYGAEMGGHFGTFPARSFYEGFWIWDNAKHVWGFMEWDIPLAKENIRILFHRQNPKTGQLPFLLPDAHGPSAQPPLFSWMAMELYRRDKDAAFLREIYPALAKWNRWWFAHSDKDGDGLPEWPDNLASGWDDSPRWDTDRKAGIGNDSGAARYAAVDLNSFLVVDLRNLAAMANVLQLEAASKRWTEQADDLAKLVVGKLYDPSDNLFYDADTRGGVFNKILTPACFMPLWAGVPISKDKAAAMIEKYLLSERHFFGAYPFPTVAYSEARYDAAGSSGYWRGPIWLDQIVFMLRILDQYRSVLRTDSAEEARRRILGMVLKHGFHENYNSQTGAPGTHSREHFSWSAAGVIAIALKRYETRK